VRVDILERLADLIRPLLSWRAAVAGSATPPKGSTGDGGFTIIPEMMSILGCSSEELGEVLKALGFRVERRPAPKQVAAAPAAEPASDTTASTTVDATADGDLTEEASDAAASTADAELAPAGAETASGGEVTAEASDQTDEAGTAEAAIQAEAMPPPETTSESATDAEVTYIEIWRPRRRQRSDRHGQRAPGSEVPREGAARHGHGHHHGKKDRQQRPLGGRPHQDRRDRRTKDEQRRRPDDRPRQEFRSASPKKATVDPDSPFAALSALRSELEKRAKEPGTT
jgi:ATP-dependent RNA helicase SUPV3L1/SUV3